MLILIPDSCTGPDITAGINYANAVMRAGHIPVVMPHTDNPETIRRAMTQADGLLLPGGEDDVNPSHYGESPLPEIGPVNERRDAFEMALLRQAAQQRKPVLGICRGIQVINACFGGSLWQDLPTQMPLSNIEHNRPDAKWSGVHDIVIEPQSRLAHILGVTHASVNSTHHQAVHCPAPGFVTSAHSADGVVEAIEHTDLPIIGVQFHPERLATGEDSVFTRLFQMNFGRH